MFVDYNGQWGAVLRCTLMVALLSFATQPALQLVTSETEVKEQDPTMFLMLAYFLVGLNAATLVVSHPLNHIGQQHCC